MEVMVLYCIRSHVCSCTVYFLSFFLHYSRLLFNFILILHYILLTSSYLSNSTFSPVLFNISEPGQHHSFPDSPLTEFMMQQAARLSVYYVFIISVSFWFNKHWNMVAERLHSLSQDFYLSGDLIPFWSVRIGGYFWVPVPGGHGAHILNASNCCARFDIH